MSDFYASSVIRSSIPKAGVAKRSKKTPLLSDKPFMISIIYDTLGVKMVKCSCCQRLGQPYIVDSSSTPLVCSEYLKVKKACDSIGLTIVGAIRLAGQIQLIKDKLKETKAARRCKFVEFAKAEALLNRTRQSKSFLKARGRMLVRRGLESLELDLGADEDQISAAVEAPPIVPDFVWDSETERAFAPLVDPDVSGGTLLLTEGTS